jgi:hypothetical protein
MPKNAQFFQRSEEIKFFLIKLFSLPGLQLKKYINLHCFI